MGLQIVPTQKQVGGGGSILFSDDKLLHCLMKIPSSMGSAFC